MTKKINTLLLVIMMIMSGAFAAMAVPAKPGWQTIEQSDGTMLKVKAVGQFLQQCHRHQRRAYRSPWQ